KKKDFDHEADSKEVNSASNLGFTRAFRCSRGLTLTWNEPDIKSTPTAKKLQKRRNFIHFKRSWLNNCKNAGIYYQMGEKSVFRIK
ncbi:MAG: hypothetical protein E7E23_22445, partial [Paenibacillus sp.]|uniref:hypothetical protein n=1 Tax=Paenibacillus sp. TaxID=58172 RepID=UPI0029025850